MIIGDTCGFCAQDILPQCTVLKRLLSCMSSNLEMISGYASLRSSAATAEKSYYINLVDEYKYISQKATKHCEIVQKDILVGVLKLEAKLLVVQLKKVYKNTAKLYGDALV